MRQLSNIVLRREFVAWQCRIRQISLRDRDGEPMPAMRPRISSRKGEVLSPGVMTLLVPLEPAEATAFIRFQVQKTADSHAVRDAVVRYLASEFYQLPELFADEMTAVFGDVSEAAARLVKLKEVLLDFSQYAQTYRMFCKVRRLPKNDAAHEFSLWQARAFNPNIPATATVLGFKPDWRSAIGVNQ
jgi:hypothetical protein